MNGGLQDEAGGRLRSFHGVYWQRGYRKVAPDTATPCSDWEARWRTTSSFFYQLESDHRFDHWSGRIIVEWGAGTRSWHQHLRNKPVLEILAPGRKLAAFGDYLEFSLPFRDLQSLYRNPDAHADWRSSLSAVAGIYLLLHEATGQLYVGSACGAEGIWGRWKSYANTGHGGNRLLVDLLARDAMQMEAFRFSILQILPGSASPKDVLAREGRFKDKLGSRAIGLGLNAN